MSPPHFDVVALSDHMVRQLTRIGLTDRPWAHSYVENSVPLDLARQLTWTFGRFNTASFEEMTREKTYRLRTGRIDAGDLDALPSDGWRALVEVLSGADYRRAVAALTRTPLDDADLTLDVWEYRSGDWLAPHVDKPEKLVTQIFYFTEHWADGDGGRLLILSSSNASDVARALAPRIGCSALLVRSETSSHAVEQPEPGAAPRRSVTATFWTSGTAPAGA